MGGEALQRVGGCPAMLAQAPPPLHSIIQALKWRGLVARRRLPRDVRSFPPGGRRPGSKRIGGCPAVSRLWVNRDSSVALRRTGLKLLRLVMTPVRTMGAVGSCPNERR